MKEYKRNCKDCGEIIEYNSPQAYYWANKHNSSCRSCGAIKQGKAISGANHPMYGKYGKNNPMYGKKHSKATRKKISEAQSGANNTFYGKLGKDSFNWKGGVRTNQGGYITIYQGNKKYKREHRIVMEEAMGRLLLPTEIVHHINEIKTDNRIENLMLFKSNSDHISWHKGKRDIKYIYPKEEKE